jgi:RNA-directed DNA polymerase
VRIYYLAVCRQIVLKFCLLTCEFEAAEEESSFDLCIVDRVRAVNGVFALRLCIELTNRIGRRFSRVGIHYRVSRAERDVVPPHKRLANAAPGCGLPIGNLSSQFFANVYLNELDQFVKHTLKAKRYVRYVDDFVLIHHDRAQLAAWLPQIEQFLQDRLRLKLKADIRLKPLTAGLDFLGYWIYPTHTLVRPRVIHHAREKLDAWQQRHVRRTANGWRINADAQQQDRLRSVWASYQGHFRHADSLRLQQAFYRRYGWLMQLAPTVFPETPNSSTARKSP